MRSLIFRFWARTRAGRWPFLGPLCRGWRPRFSAQEGSGILALGAPVLRSSRGPEALTFRPGGVLNSGADGAVFVPNFGAWRASAAGRFRAPSRRIRAANPSVVFLILGGSLDPKNWSVRPELEASRGPLISSMNRSWPPGFSGSHFGVCWGVLGTPPTLLPKSTKVVGETVDK